jgi:predicted nucleic acid-binding protein
LTRYVIDASVALKWFIPEIHHLEAQVLVQARHELIAPDLIIVEAGSAMVKKVRANEIDVADAAASLASLRALLALVPAVEMSESGLRLALEYGRSIYDSLYVALAVREACQLVTADRRLYNAVAPLLPETMLWIEELPGE